tara:strand:- start:191 stop:478 length:288 start_codon:yes stop_codon:yes gene_type:complete
MSSNTPPKDFSYARLDEEEMDQLFEQAIYAAAKALEEDDDSYDEDAYRVMEVSQNSFVQLVESFDPDYQPAPSNLDPQQCRYGVDLDSIWRGTDE